MSHIVYYSCEKWVGVLFALVYDKDCNFAVEI